MLGSDSCSLNSARAASTAWLSGLAAAIVRNQTGARLSGSSTPDSSSSGNVNMLSSGASASSLRVASASAYEMEAISSPSRASRPSTTSRTA
jgi:hypothetical protein